MVLIYFILFCAAVSTLAHKRGRRWFVWFLIAFIISPIISGLFLLCMKDLSEV